MNADEKHKLRVAMAKTVYEAHKAYITASNAAGKMGLDCRNVQNISYADGRDRVHSVLINGEPTR